MLDYSAWAAHPYLRSPSRSLLPDSVRREITELNRQFLARVVADDSEARPICWRGSDGPALHVPALLDALAPCPFTLFELRLETDASMNVDVALPAGPSASAHCVHREALAQSALTLAWRLAESSPLSMRLALGLSATAELVMNEIRVTSLPLRARIPGQLGTRWIGHRGFWNALLGAARAGDGALLAHVHCLGITLLVGELGVRPPGSATAPASATRCRR
jgi:hypothetical protein